MLFRALANADVADRGSHQDSLGTFERTQHDLDWEISSILAPPDEFKPCPDLLSECIRCGSKVVRDQPFREALWNDVLHLLTDKFITKVSELFLRLQI